MMEAGCTSERPYRSVSNPNRCVKRKPSSRSIKGGGEGQKYPNLVRHFKSKFAKSRRAFPYITVDYERMAHSWVKTYRKELRVSGGDVDRALQETITRESIPLSYLQGFGDVEEEKINDLMFEAAGREVSEFRKVLFADISAPKTPKPKKKVEDFLFKVKVFEDTSTGPKLVFYTADFCPLDKVMQEAHDVMRRSSPDRKDAEVHRFMKIDRLHAMVHFYTDLRRRKPLTFNEEAENYKKRYVLEVSRN